MFNYPKITVVTPSYNQGKFLERTILSVISQKYPNLEYIIIDGCSQDNSIDIIKKYSNSLTYWSSEKDSGQSDAINKGLRTSTGDFVTWLNSDDIFLPNALQDFAAEYNKNKQDSWFAGNIIWITEDDKIIKCRKGEKLYSSLSNYGILNLYGPSAFIKKDLLSKIGFLDNTMHYMMDTEYWWRLVKAGYKFVRLKNYTWGFRIHKDAKMSSHMFDESETKNLNHPIWAVKRNETLFIHQNYFSGITRSKKLYGTILLQIIRILSFRYLKSIWDTIRYKHKHYSTIINSD